MGIEALFIGNKSGRMARLTTYLHLVPRLRISGAIPLFPYKHWWRGEGRLNLSTFISYFFIFTVIFVYVYSRIKRYVYFHLSLYVFIYSSCYVLRTYIISHVTQRSTKQVRVDPMIDPTSTASLASW